MTRALRLALVVVVATSVLVVIPGAAVATTPGGIGRIVFVSDTDDPTGDIYVRAAAGSSPIKITSNSYREEKPKWSPDGSRIAFSRVVSNTADVWIMDPDGLNAQNLTKGVGLPNYPYDWSPDGTKIIFSSNRGGNRDLWVMNADGSNPQQLTNTPDIEWGAAWSPDGSTIAFSQNAGGPQDILLMDADGSNVRNVTVGPSSDSEPTWSPDGSKIAFTSGSMNDLDVWVMDADGSHPVNLTQSPSSSDYGSAWSPDGTKIAFTSNRDGDADLWTMNVDGSGVAHLTDRLGTEWDVDWESVNRVPVAVADKAGVRRGGAVDVAVLANDSDPDGEGLSVTDVTRMPDHGLVVINPSGTVTYTHDGTMSPELDSFEYEIQDTRLASDRAVVTISIQTGFDDVPDTNPFVDDIMWLAGQGITKGCNPPANTLFCPADPVTRGQMAAFLVRALHYTDDGGGNLFVDDNGSVFELDIDKLRTAGVTRGCNPPLNDRFCPDELVTRGQMAAFLARAFKLTDLGMSDLFVDDNGSIFEAEIDKLGATGVSRGCDPPVNDRFCPDEPVTREQMAAFIHRAVDYIL